MRTWCGLMLALVSTAACGSDPSPDNPTTAASSTGAGAEGGSGGEGGGTGGGGAPPDAFDLSHCTDPAVAWPAPTQLTAQSWAATDEPLAMCSLRSLDGFVEGRKVLCSGEHDHGVSESSRWHAHLARYLAHTARLRVVALEDIGANVDHVDAYVQTGDESELAIALAGTENSFGDSAEQRQLFEALRRVALEIGALDDGSALHVVGFDVAVQPKLTREALLDFLTVVAPAEVATWEDALPDLAAGVDWIAAGEAAADLHAQIEAQQAAYVAATDEARWKRARRDAANLRDGYRFLDMYLAGDFTGGDAEYREPGLIRNMDEIAADLPEGDRVMMISHNIHCGRLIDYGPKIDGSPSPAVGTYLGETLGDGYGVIAQLYAGGSHLVRSGSGFEAKAFTSGPNTLERAISEATAADGLLVGGASEVPVDLGASWKVWQLSPFIPSEMFDGILWLRTVGPTTPAR